MERGLFPGGDQNSEIIVFLMSSWGKKKRKKEQLSKMGVKTEEKQQLQSNNCSLNCCVILCVSVQRREKPN